jgi:transcriptional regulator with XRE-family HTH domain
MPRSAITDDAIVADLGRRVARHRTARALTQDEFAAEAGVGRSTVQRIESGASIQLSSFVKMLRALERLDALDAVLAPEVRSPLADLERERTRRRRVRHSRTSPEPAQATPWTWGDDPDSAA